MRPTTVTEDGVLASLPVDPLFELPRAKPLPKRRPETKWERFAKTKGISPRARRDRLVFDEQSQEWCAPLHLQPFVGEMAC